MPWIHCLRSSVFMLQIRAPSLKCACSNDAMKHVCKLKHKIPPIGTTQAPGEPEISV